MNRIKKRRIAAMLAACCLLAGMTVGCGKKEEEQTKKQESVKIPMVLTVNPSTGKKNEEAVVKEFNEAYKGTLQIDVEWIMETEEDYRQNLKRQNVTDELPAVVTDLRMLPSFYRMMIQNERLEEISSYIKKDEEWNSMIEPFVLEACSEPDGKMYLAPLSTAAFSCSGVFWNEELFAQAGITSFPETWEEFWRCCETLKAHGITPLALHTEGTAWAPMLFATAEVAETETGLDFMKELYPDSYQNAEGIRMAQTLKCLFSYTTEDALYADFDTAYSNFFSGKAAMVPNGYWMIDQIPEEYEKKVRFSAFPGNKLISSPETFGWAIVSDYSEEVKEGALEFLKFRTKKNQEEKEALFSEDRSKLLPAEKDYLDAYEKDPQIVPNYQVKWNSILQEETLGEELPKLVQGKISAEEFTEKEDDSIRQFLEEQ
nr:ABC transporter substrate-binding protein [uncultured Faecalimonas sp.]